MTARHLRAGVVVAAVVLAAGTACGGGGSDGTAPVIVLSSHPGTAASDLPVSRVVTLRLASAPGIGKYLVASGRALYMYPPDRRRNVTCTARKACATAWPPLFVPSGDRVHAGPGVRQSLVGTIRGDGGTVATYNKWPLYFYIGDRRPGQVTGQGQGFDWYVIGPNGAPIRSNLS